MITRRQSLRLSGHAAAALVAAGPLLAGRRARALPTGDLRPQSIDWATFLADLEALTQAQHEAGWDPACHVARVATLLGELDVTDAPVQAQLDRYLDARRERPELRTLHDGGDHEVVALQFAPGDTIGLHDHPRMTGVILCITGSVHIQAYNRLGPTSKDGTLRIQQVEDVVLQPGDHATLTEHHGNIHTLVAPEWCELIDVFTPPYTPDRIRDYRRYVRSAEPVQGTDVFLAREA